MGRNARTTLIPAAELPDVDVPPHLGLEVGLRRGQAPLGVFEFVGDGLRAERRVVSPNVLAVRRRRAGDQRAEEPVLGRLGLAVATARLNASRSNVLARDGNSLAETHSHMARR